MTYRQLLTGLGLLFLLVGRGRGEGGLMLSSLAFAPGGELPARFTCDGAGVSPPLSWSGSPAGTKSFALVVVDPDVPDPAAPQRSWFHWVLYDLPPETNHLDEGVAPASLPFGTRQGRNDAAVTGWEAACPPIGRHRYIVRLYALDAALGDRGALSGAQLERAVTKHLLARVELVGTYRRNR